jgi:hypothetical protein
MVAVRNLYLVFRRVTVINEHALCLKIVCILIIKTWQRSETLKLQSIIMNYSK